MERHKCKLCSRKFSNGRALGGHMKAHLAPLPLPPKPQPFLNHSASFSCSFSSSSEEEDEDEAEEKINLVYGLRENPKKSFRVSDPESVVQDKESETESKNPTKRRSKRTRKPLQNLEAKKTNLMSFMDSPEPVSSVCDTSPEEDVAMCLMMLSRDKWRRSNNVDVDVNNVVVVVVVKEQEEEEEVEKSMEKEKSKLRKVRGKQQCENCGKRFRSSGALGSHRSICVRGGDDDEASDEKIFQFQCPFCDKVFGSGQALGGHKRSHMYPSSSSTTASGIFKQSFFDLNLPASPEEEDDDLSVVSDA